VSQFILALLSAVRVFFRSRHDTALEILALRQQVAVLKRKRPRPRLNPWDRLFWTDVAPRLVSMDRRPDRGETRDGGRLAPCGISALLEMAVTSRWRPTGNHG
jgi:hypothetical protein